MYVGRGGSPGVYVYVYMYMLCSVTLYMRCAVYGNVRRKPRNVHASCNCKRRPRPPPAAERRKAARPGRPRSTAQTYPYGNSNGIISEW